MDDQSIASLQSGADEPRSPAGRLTREEMEHAVGNRSAMARMIAEHYDFPVKMTKRQLRDLFRTERAEQVGRAPGGKRMRRARERASQEISGLMLEGVRLILATGGLAGGTGPRILGRTDETGLPGETERVEINGESELPGQIGEIEPRHEEEDELSV